MSTTGCKRRFAWGRFVVLCALAATVGVATVEYVRPERFTVGDVASAEFVVSVESDTLPTADQIRRRALSTSNLTAVYRQLIGPEGGMKDAATDDAVPPTLDRWRRQLAVEVVPLPRRDACRVRFVVVDAAERAEAEILVATVAAQYAGEIAAETSYESIDRLRRADDRLNAATADLLDAVRGHATAQSEDHFPRLLPAAAASQSADTAAPSAENADEYERLRRLRSELLQTLQPAHPEVVALDSRLNSLRLAANDGEIQRMSGGIALPASALAAQDKLRPQLDGLPEPVAGAAEQLIAARTAMRLGIDELMEPSAAEIPVVETQGGARQIWDLRSFWHLAALVPAALLAASLSWRSVESPGGVATVEREVHGAATIRRDRYPPASAGTEPTPATATVTSAATAATRALEDRPLHTVDRAASALGAPLLAVVRRRRDGNKPSFTST